MEPLLTRLIKGYVDDDDLTRRLKALYQVPRNRGFNITVARREISSRLSQERVLPRNCK